MYYKIVKLLGDIVCSLVIDKRMGFYFCNVKMNVLYSKIYLINDIKKFWKFEIRCRR